MQPPVPLLRGEFDDAKTGWRQRRCKDGARKTPREENGTSTLRHPRKCVAVIARSVCVPASMLDALPAAQRSRIPRANAVCA